MRFTRKLRRQIRNINIPPYKFEVPTVLDFFIHWYVAHYFAASMPHESTHLILLRRLTAKGPSMLLPRTGHHQKGAAMPGETGHPLPPELLRRMLRGDQFYPRAARGLRSLDFGRNGSP